MIVRYDVYGSMDCQVFKGGIKNYRFSSNSFRGNYSFLKVEKVEIFI